MMFFTEEQWTIDILGEPVTLSDVSFYTPAVRADDVKGHITALRAGRGADRKVHLRPAEKDGAYRIYSASRFPWDVEIVPESSGLPGIKEHRSAGA